MHVAFNGWFWDSPHVGSGQYLHRLLYNLRQIDPTLNMTLILPPHIQSVIDVPENVNLIATSGPGGRLGKIWFEQRTFPKMIAQCKADIAHVPYWGPPLSSPARLVTSILDVVQLIIPNYTATLGSRLYLSLVRAASNNMAHTITISASAQRDIVAYLGIPVEAITVTHLGIDDRFHPRMGAEHDEAVRQKYSLPERFVLYLGGFDVRKQVDLLLFAYTYVVQGDAEQTPLVLAGKEPTWGTAVFPDMRAYAQKLDLEETLYWCGYIDEADKPALYRLADVFVSPSMYEGFGLPVLEAMASGTPVVANKISVYEEILGDGAYLTDNARSMAGAILALLNQEDFRQSMINQGLAQATPYRWRSTAEKTREVYQKVIQQ